MEETWRARQDGVKRIEAINKTRIKVKRNTRIKTRIIERIEIKMLEYELEKLFRGNLAEFGKCLIIN